MDDTPTEEEFLQIVERIFGSRSPDFQAYKERTEDLLQVLREEAETEVDRKHAEAKAVHLKATGEAAHAGLNNWDELDDEMRSTVVQTLSRCEEMFDRENYLA